MCYGWGKGNDQVWGSGCDAIAGCHYSVPISVSYVLSIAGCHYSVPISVSYVLSIFRATNFIQTPKKTAMNFVLSFLQITLFSILITQKTWFLLFRVYAGKISNRGRGRRTTLAEWTWHPACPIAGSSGCGAIAGCHPRVPFIVVWYGWGGRVKINFGGVDMVSLLSAMAIVVCYNGGKEGSGRGAIAGCHRRVICQCAMVGGVTTN